jgi:hypothetical protein
MKKAFALLAVSAMLALPAVASAQTTGYGSPSGAVQTTIQHGTAPSTSKTISSTPAAATTAPASKGNLPFTGLQVGLVAIAGLALVGTGIGLRKLGSHRAG